MFILDAQPALCVNHMIQSCGVEVEKRVEGFVVFRFYLIGNDFIAGVVSFIVS